MCLYNDDGIVRGRVVGPDDRPVAGAKVILSEKSLLVTAPRDSAMTDAKGEFMFKGHKFYHLYLEAAKEGVGRVSPREYHLYFKGQNMTLKAPLRLVEAP